MKFPMTWDLERIFEGGSQSEAFFKKLKEINEQLNTLEKEILQHAFSKIIPHIQTLALTIKEMGAFVECLLSETMKDTHAGMMRGKFRPTLTRFSNLKTHFDGALGSLADEDFQDLIKTFPSLTFPLTEKRNIAQSKLPPKQEAFINDLAMDGYDGWAELWDASIGEMDFDGLSFGQIENKLSDSNRIVRKEAFELIEKTFASRAETFAQTLNHIAGFRIQVYKKRGWESILKEPCMNNRISEKTALMIYQTIESFHKPLGSFLESKADLLGVDCLSWYDLEAPLSKAPRKIDYQTGAEMVLKAFETFSPQMAALSKRALENRWIEAEDRQGKRPGGFCTEMPLTGESRIFMTYSDTITNVFTLAHELGHAFHNAVLQPMEEMVQHPSMGLAETASTMGEMIVTQATIQAEKDPKEKLSLLDDHLSRAISYLMNIHARFSFEKAFYEKRKQGFVTSEDLSKLMEDVQRKAYGDALDTYHPLFWASKGHFYCTDEPFYNFPYTFGYLFSLGIYDFALSSENFEETFIALLEDTGRMSVEDLGKKHLQTDLSTPTFWNRGLKIIEKDIETYNRLKKEMT